MATNNIESLPLGAFTPLEQATFYVGLPAMAVQYLTLYSNWYFLYSAYLDSAPFDFQAKPPQMISYNHTGTDTVGTLSSEAHGKYIKICNTMSRGLLRDPDTPESQGTADVDTRDTAPYEVTAVPGDPTEDKLVLMLSPCHMWGEFEDSAAARKRLEMFPARGVNFWPHIYHRYIRIWTGAWVSNSSVRMQIRLSVYPIGGRESVFRSDSTEIEEISTTTVGSRVELVLDMDRTQDYREYRKEYQKQPTPLVLSVEAWLSTVAGGHGHICDSHYDGDGGSSTETPCFGFALTSF